MSTHCIFYRTGKRMNSTLQPSVDANTWEVDCNFFEPFDILSPEILLRDEGLGAAGPPNNNHIMDYNYVYIQAPIERYYFINKWERIKGIWHGYTSEDVLASWRNTILETQQYITRSSIKWNNDIPDTFYGYRYTNYNKQIGVKGVKSEGPTWYNMRDYLVKTYPDSPYDSPESNKYMAVLSTTPSGYRIGTDIFQATSFPYGTITIGAAYKICQNLKQTDVEKIQRIKFINDLFLLPFEIPGSKIQPSFRTKDINALLIGKYDNTNQTHLGDTYDFIDTVDEEKNPFFPLTMFTTVRTTWTINIPNKSSITSENTPEYIKYTIAFQPFGNIDIAAQDLINYSQVVISAETDVLTGNCALYLGSDALPDAIPKRLLATSNVRIPLQIREVSNTTLSYERAQVTRDWNMATSGFNAIQSFAGALNPAHLFGSAVSGVENLTMPFKEEQNKIPIQTQNNIVGNLGTCFIDDAPTLLVQRYRLTDRDDARFGRPLCEKLVLGSQLTGATSANNYTIKNPGLVVCQGAQIKSGTGIEIGQGILAAERAAIESALNGGVYLE